MGDPQKLPMKNNIWKLTALLICIGILINIISFKLNADEKTYVSAEYYTDSSHTGYKANNIYGADLIEIRNNYSNQTNPNVEVRTTVIQNGTTHSIYFVALSNPGFGIRDAFITVNNTEHQQYWGSNNKLWTERTYNNVTYYTWSFNTQGTPSSYVTGYIKPDGYSVEQMSYRLTFGDLAETSPSWGELIINYRQNIYTEHPENNLDIISWNAYMDTAGNDLQGKNIEIQAIAGYFEGSSYADLKQTRFSDWLASTHPAVTMYKGTIELSHQEYNWGTVASKFRSINTLGTWFWNIFTNEGTWYQYGWRYQARLLDEDLEPLTEWQLIYTGNSYSPSATEILTDDEPLTPDDVDTINDINDENGTTNNWYINNTVITNNEYNQTFQQNIIENIYNILQGTPDDGLHNKADDVQQTIDNAIDTEDDYLNDLQTKLNDLELNDITQNNGLMKALRWVREVHHETIETTVIGPIVLTIMLIGLITYLIGRRNG